METLTIGTPAQAVELLLGPVGAPERKTAGLTRLTIPLEQVRRSDVALVGGKGANLGEMLAAGLPVPSGFVATVQSYQRFIEANGLRERVARELSAVNVDDVASLERIAGELRALVSIAPVPDDVRTSILLAYRALGSTLAHQGMPVAIRSSATAEDAGELSFAGMFESFVNVAGEEAVVDRVRACWASTFSARSLFYRAKRGHQGELSVAVVVQQMVDAVKSGVMFTVDPSTGDATHVVIEAVWGFGEAIVGGQVIPDHYVLNKHDLAVIRADVSTKEFLLALDPAGGGLVRVKLEGDPRASARVLDDAELTALGDLAQRLEKLYGKPQDAEFAIDAAGLFLTQTRPITTLGTAPVPVAERSADKQTAPAILLRGLGASPGVGSGTVRVLAAPSDVGALVAGEILVAHVTTPDWVPLMRKAAAIVTDEGGMTSHAAIVSRELGIPCVVGTLTATHTLATGTFVTVDGGAGTVVRSDPASAAKAAAASPVSGSVTSGIATRRTPLVTGTKLYVNLAEPSRAEEIAKLDVDGVGLLRAEFMLLDALHGTHPRVLLVAGRGEEFVTHMSAQLRVFARAFHPRPVIYRATDFRSNEFRGLTGGQAFEPVEENPMIGFRGAYRYVKEPDLFRHELRALATVRAEFDNLHLMIPFVRTGWELEACLRLVDESPLGADRRLMRWVMAEVPSVVSWIPRYAQLGISGVSIGSNDLTQLMLGVDRDSTVVAPLFDERDLAVVDAVRAIIAASHRAGMTCSICGQAPSVYPEYADMLVQAGIDSISVNPDVIDRTRANIAAAEQRLVLSGARHQT